jgi:PTH1 family peptidyl-tRNA hydrolase
VLLVVGLGNPGREYEDTRHNIGFIVVDEIARRLGGQWKDKFGGQIAQTARGDRQLVLLKPMEYMNLSGHATQRTASFFKIAANDILVVHDDIDLPFGDVRVKVGGGHGGHNGLRSITEQLGPAFMRVRCGVGKPASKEKVVGHVLGGFSKEEQKELPFFVQAAADAVELVVTKGPVAAMNHANQKKKETRST